MGKVLVNTLCLVKFLQVYNTLVCLCQPIISVMLLINLTQREGQGQGPLRGCNLTHIEECAPYFDGAPGC
jgi:hypothetical protein